MADQLERVTNLLALLLNTRQPLTMFDIINSLHGQYPGNAVAQRGSFERDKSLLRDLGVVIHTEVLAGALAGQTGYRVLRADYELPPLDLADDERRALQVAIAASRTTDAQFGALKLGADATDEARLRTELPANDALPTLHAAIRSRHPVTFGYRQRPRRIDPYALVLRSGWWYMLGFDHSHDAVRTFRVDRIEGTVVVDATAGVFDRPHDFDVRAEFPEDPKTIGDGATATAVVSVNPRVARSVISELGNESVIRRHDDGRVDVEVPCANRDAFRQWLLGLGDDAVVTEPGDVVADVVGWLHTMVGQ